jgi:RNA polymerase sigma factor for flagellar operon FliA
MDRVAMYADTEQQCQSQALLLEEHAGLVKRIAYHLIARLPHTVDVDDLIQAGMMGLLDASQNYNASQGASFETYAGIRIRGAILDEIRRNDWAPRSVHRKAREIADVMHQLEQELGRHPTDNEVAKRLNISLEDYHQQLHDSSGHQVFSLNDFSDSDESHAHPISENVTEPEQETQDSGFHAAMVKAIESLPERERLMMSLYYNDELNLKEIGEVLSISESRVSQIHSQTVIRLRSKLRDWID